MRIAALVLVALASVGCIHINEHEAPLPKGPTVQQQVDASVARNQARAQAVLAERAARLAESNRRQAASVEAARAARLEAKQDAERQRCAAGREERLKAVAANEAAIDHANELREWESKHCKYEEKAYQGTSYVKVDPNGRLYATPSTDWAQVRVCDAKLPKDLEHVRSGDLFVPHIDTDVSCESYDREALTMKGAQ